ncbi:MAG: imidazole glycerol phosphate synthase subunit HisH [Candidatus Omnitrophica bacterium]|nr:imidazole glycerol phosphate synthase subunit HisH [Candidatus Omnitrophota bacterium]
MIAIVDYGMGNLASVAKAVAFLGGSARVTSDPKVVARSGALILPGVGAFGEAMEELKVRRLRDPIVGSIREGKPFLGLCLGLQLLFEASEESPGVKGLGVLPGRVRRLPRSKGLKVPHMGWNQIKKVRGSGFGVRDSLLDGLPDGAFVYFVHSYYADPKEKQMILATTEYGCRFPSIVSNGDRLWATQFHPEKSQRWGLTLLRNFLRVVESC